MRIGVMSNEAGRGFTEYMIGYLKNCSHTMKYIDENSSYAKEIEPLDCAVSIGGDGTVLGLARIVGDKPIFGINHGHLGFLTDMKKNHHMAEIFHMIEKKQYTLEKRSRLEAMVVGGETGNILSTITALNDIVIKGSVAKMCRLSTHVNGEFVAKFPADGIIIATATGSTGYSLSAGGPIVPPNIPVNVITPICSHSLNARSMIVSNEHKIEIIVDSHHPELLVSADGQWDIEIKSGESVLITKSKMTTNFIRIKNESFYRTMSNKLGWNWE